MTRTTGCCDTNPLNDCVVRWCTCSLPANSFQNSRGSADGGAAAGGGFVGSFMKAMKSGSWIIKHTYDNCVPLLFPQFSLTSAFGSYSNVPHVHRCTSAGSCRSCSKWTLGSQLHRPPDTATAAWCSPLLRRQSAQRIQYHCSATNTTQAGLLLD